MVVKKSLFKGKLIYWLVLIIALSLYIPPQYYRMQNPEYFISEPTSNYIGEPILNCSYSQENILESNTYIVKDGIKCLIVQAPRISYFHQSHPLLYTLSIKWGWMISIFLIIICFIPRKENESKYEEKQAKKKD